MNPFFGVSPFAAPTPTNGIPEFLVRPNVESEFINDTGVLVNNELFTAPTTFTSNGVPIPQQQRIATNSAPFGEFSPNCATCFQTDQFEQIIPKSDRVGGNLRLDYEITPNLTFTLDETLLQREVYGSAEPPICFFCYVLQPDNAFITPAIRAAALAQNPAFTDGQLFVNRFLDDAGPGEDYERRVTEWVVPKLSGEFDARFAQINWDVSFNFGESDNWFSDRNTELTGNFDAAIELGNQSRDWAAGLSDQRAVGPASGLHAPGRHRGESGELHPLQSVRAAEQARRDQLVGHHRLGIPAARSGSHRLQPQLR